MATPSISSARSGGARPPKANLAARTPRPSMWGENHQNARRGETETPDINDTDGVSKISRLADRLV